MFLELVGLSSVWVIDPGITLLQVISRIDLRESIRYQQRRTFRPAKRAAPQVTDLANDPPATPATTTVTCGSGDEKTFLTTSKSRNGFCTTNRVVSTQLAGAIAKQ